MSTQAVDWQDDKKYTPETAEPVMEMSAAKIRRLIEAGMLPAVNTSTGKQRPRYIILESSIRAFFNPALKTSVKATAQRTRRQRIDANVEKVF